MSQYIHHVPGRLRIRSQSLRCRSDKALAAQNRLVSMDGVQSVRINPRAGSITILYDANALRQADLLSALHEVGCMSAAVRSDEHVRKVADTFGKALVGAVMQKAVEQSARTLVGALI